MKHSRIQESREKYDYNSATKENRIFANSKPREKSQNQYYENLNTRKLPDLQYVCVLVTDLFRGADHQALLPAAVYRPRTLGFKYTIFDYDVS